MTRARFWLGLLGAAAVVGGVFVVVGHLVPRPADVRFRGSTFEFALPPRWTCTLEETEWVCQSTDARHRREAIIIMASKVRGPQDGLAQYHAYLARPKTGTTVDGDPLTSEVRSVTRRTRNAHEWVDALHFESELPGFLTRYLATVTSGVGVVITFSAVEARYDDYETDLERMLESLVVYESAAR